MDDPVFYRLCEALLFSSPAPVAEDTIMKIAREYVDEADLMQFSCFITWFNQRSSGLQLIKIAGGWQIVTRSEFSDAVRRLKTNTQKARFSKAALETLAIVVYRQPVTGPEIESIRGVESSGILKNLLEKKLITVLGRRKGPGNPLLYGTTQQFLLTFGLDNLDSLPSLNEYETSLGVSIHIPAEIPFSIETEQPSSAIEEISDEEKH